MMIPWWEHSEKVWKAQTDRQTDRRTDGRTNRQTDRETGRKTDNIFLKGKSIWKCYLQNVGRFFFRPKYRLIWCLFFIKVYHQPKLKREIVHISKFHNEILYQSKKIYLIHSQFHRSACRIRNESKGCAQHDNFISNPCTMYPCANKVHQFTIYTICVIYYTKYHTIQYRNHVMNRKKRYLFKYFRNISWDIYISIISQNEIYPYFA